MKSIVVFSDLHMHPWTYGSIIVKGRNSRLEQQKNVVKEIVKYCVDRNISEVFFCGDLFHTSTISAEVGQATYDAFKTFKENKITLYVIRGNHDQANKEGSVNALSFLRELSIVYSGGILESYNSGTDDTKYSFIPFQHESNSLKEEIKKAEGSRFLFMHQGVGGVEINSKGFTLNEILTPDMVSSNISLAFSGHYHSYKVVSSNLIIPGSTVQLNWGDEGERRGWLEVKYDGDEIKEVIHVESPASKFITLHEEAFNQESEALPNLHNNFIRVIASKSSAPDLEQMILKDFGAASAEIKYNKIENAPTNLNSVKLASFNEVIYSFAASKERAGIISEYDKAIGERLLKDNYILPQV